MLDHGKWKTRLIFVNFQLLLVIGKKKLTILCVFLQGYQFWTQTDTEGYFLINNVITGNYSLYAWIPGFIGDYMHDAYINVNPGLQISFN